MVDLVDARDARGCPSCRGLWIEQAVLTDMILEMLPPLSRTLARLQLAVLQRAGEALPCPTCGDPMVPTSIHRVELDCCAKGHGVWFDVDELRIALLRVANASDAPVVAIAEPQPRSTPSMPPNPPPEVDPAAPRLVFRVTAPGAQPYEVALQRPVIKIGRLASSHLRLADESASRMHAVIECTEDKVAIIDLGSTTGTKVNGERVNRRALVAGDRLQLAGTTIELRSIAPGG